jgi:hypothetical protein
MNPLRMIASTALIVAASAGSAGAVSVDLTSGTSGTLVLGQSFNETRGVDVTVQGSEAQVLTSMTLRGLNIGTPTGTVGARVYQSGTGLLLASGSTAVTSGTNQTVTVPISAVLAAGGTYRLSFFVSAGFSGGSGTMFDPSPAGTGGFPYTESTGTLVIVQAYSIGFDAYPTNQNIFVPLISAELTRATAVMPTSWGSLKSLYR